MPQTVLVTGASRGIGLGLVRVLAGAGYSVVATCRSPAHAPDLAQLLRAADQVSCDWWRAGHVTTSSPLIGPGARRGPGRGQRPERGAAEILPRDQQGQY